MKRADRSGSNITQPLAEIDAPFVLLDDASGSPDARALLFTAPSEIIACTGLDEINPLIDAIDRATGQGAWMAGYLGYEAGHAFEERTRAVVHADDAGAPPLAWFGRFDGVSAIDPADIPALLPDPDGASVSDPAPQIDRREYEAKVEQALELIRAGEIYQANLTFAALVKIAGHPLAAYARLRDAARAPFGAVAHTGGHWILSLSPERFFSLSSGEITVTPMKGTAARHESAIGDRAAVRALAADPKQRAENLMIVDLMRNDLSRIAARGSVAVPSLYDIETYPTVHQMTSSVTARLAQGRRAGDVLRAAFPCGSVTGAPKIRAMQAIADLEGRARGPYTGSIGYVAPDGDAQFNVAIRTLVCSAGAEAPPVRAAAMGLGSGIVADSKAGDEWRECLAKGAFVSRAAPRFDLLETMQFEPRDGLVRLEAHLRRLAENADSLGFPFDRHAARNLLQAATFRHREMRAVRLILSRGGAMAVEIVLVPKPIGEPVQAGVAPHPYPRSDIRRWIKTSDRAGYEAARSKTGMPEAVLLDADGQAVEGCFTNIFVERDGALITPPASLGMIAGVLRAELLADGRAIEGGVTLTDLEQGFFVGNSLRGLMRAELAARAPDR